MNIFEQAARKRVRFPAGPVLLTTEDVILLPLTSITGRPNLDSLAIDLSTRLNAATASFVPNKTKTDTTLELMLDIVKSVIATRVAENEAKAQRAALEANQARIKELIIRKSEDKLAELTIEELQAMLVV